MVSPFYTVIIAFAILGSACADKKPQENKPVEPAPAATAAKAPSTPELDDVKERKIREIKWDHGAWRPLDAPCPTCREGALGGAPKEPGVISASPRPNRQANNNLINNPAEKQPKQQPQQQQQPVVKPANQLFEVKPQFVQQQQQQQQQQQLEINRPVPNQQPQIFLPPVQKPALVQPSLPLANNPPPGGRFIFPNDGKIPSHKMQPPLPPPPPPPPAFGPNIFPQRLPIGNPGSTVHLLPTATLPQGFPDPRRPFPPNQGPRPSADKVIVEVNQVPSDGPQPEVTVGKGSGKPRVQLIYIPAAALRGRKDPLSGIKGPVTDKLLAELNLPGAKIVSVVKTDPDSNAKFSAPPGVKQLSPFSATGKLNLDFVKSFLPNGAELISIRGLNGELDVDGSLTGTPRPFPTPQPDRRPTTSSFLQALANTVEAGLREGEQKAKELESDRNRPVSPRFRPPVNLQPLRVEQAKPSSVIEKVVLSDPNPVSSDPTISNPLNDDGLALVLNMKAFKVKQDLSLMIHNEEKRETMGIEEVIRSLRAVKNFGDPSVGQDYPEVFIAPSSLNPPRNYAKVRLDIPKESERLTSGSPAPASLPNAYIASRNHLPPEGFVKINLPREIRTVPVVQSAFDFETRNPQFKDSSEQKLESGSQFVPRPFTSPFGQVPSPVNQLGSPLSSLQKFWIPPPDQKGNELDNDEKAPKSASVPYPVPTTIRPQVNFGNNGYRFWPTTKNPAGTFGQLFHSQFFGGSSSTPAPPSSTAAPVSYTTTRYTPTSSFPRFPVSTVAPTYKYSFPPFAPSTTPSPPPTYTTFHQSVSSTFAPAPLPYDIPPPELPIEAAPLPGEDLPEAFIGPSDIETPEGYVKIQLPVPGIENPNSQQQQNAENSRDNLPEFFIAPADQEPPEGYVRIALPVAGNNNEDKQTQEEAPATSAPFQRAPGRLFTRPVTQQTSEEVNAQQPQRRRPAYLRPRTRSTTEKPATDGAEEQLINEVSSVTETAKLDEPSKDNSSTLFPPYQEAVRRFRGKYVSDSLPDASSPTTTPASPSGRRIRPVTRRPFAPGGRRKVLLGRRPINRSRNDLANQEDPKEEASATTVQPPEEDSTQHTGDLQSSGSRFVYHHNEGVNAVVRSPERSDDDWWAVVNAKPLGEPEVPQSEDSAFVVDSLPSEPIRESREDGTFSSYVPLPADGSVEETYVPSDDEYSVEKSEEPSDEVLASEDQPEEEAVEDNTEIVVNAQESPEVSQSAQAVTPETFTATVPGLKQILVDQGLDPEFAAEVSDEAEKSGDLYSVPKLEEDSKFPWKYTTINRNAKPEDEEDAVQPEATEDEGEPKEEEVKEGSPEEEAEDAKSDVLILEPPPRDAEDAPLEDEGSSPNDIKILGVSTATEVSQESVICFRGKCIQQNGRK